MFVVCPLPIQVPAQALIVSSASSVEFYGATGYVAFVNQSIATATYGLINVQGITYSQVGAVVENVLSLESSLLSPIVWPGLSSIPPQLRNCTFDVLTLVCWLS